MEIDISHQLTKNLDNNIDTIIKSVILKASEIYGLDEKDEVSVLLCHDDYIHELNKTYRKIDRPTDVLSFALNEGDASDPNSIKGTLLGDIIISMDTASRQAEEYGHSIEREIAFLATHGILHLLGYDHEIEDERLEMRAEEEFLLAKVGYLRE